MPFSFAGALMALVPAARRAFKAEEPSRAQLIRQVALLNASRARMMEHIEIVNRELELERRATARWQAEVERLNQGAHRCQHQADLNRAMAQQHFAQYGQAAQAQMQQQAQCQRALSDCGMHHAERIVRLHDLMRNF